VGAAVHQSCGQERSALVIVPLQDGVDPALLRPLPARFPTYEVVDLADLLERH
jgi:hypothetical protein